MSSVSRLEVITTGARRRWTLEEKRRIVAESYRAPRIVSATARRHGLTPTQLFTWRRLDSEGRLTCPLFDPITGVGPCLSHPGLFRPGTCSRTGPACARHSEERWPAIG